MYCEYLGLDLIGGWGAKSLALAVKSLASALEVKALALALTPLALAFEFVALTPSLALTLTTEPLCKKRNIFILPHTLTVP